jgi:zinc/manganese transport system substrate-binding protein
MTTSRVRALLGAVAIAVLAGVSACGSSSATASSGTITVVAGENVWGDIARQIGGTHVEVTSVINDPDADPHEFESNPADAATLAKAKIVIENGAGYDDFMDKLLSAAGGGKTVINVEKVNALSGSDVNPHLWYSPTYVTAAANAFEAEFAKADPAHAKDYAQNLQAFLTAYTPYQQTIDTIKQKYAGGAIAYTERVPGYLVEAAGLHLGTPASFSQAVEDDSDPSPQDTAAFDKALKDHTVKALLYNSQVTDQQTKALKGTAESAKVPVVGVAETLPKDQKDFQTWQIAQAKELLTALGG